MMKRVVNYFFQLMVIVLPIACSENVIPVGNYTGDIVETVGNNRISRFVFDSEGYVWLSGAECQYLFKTDEANIIRYAHNDAEPGSLSSNKVNFSIIDDNGVAWFATQRGVDRYDRTNGCFEHIGLDDKNSYVVSIAISPNGRICIATRRNILEFDKSSNYFISKLEIPFISISHEPSIFFDSSENLWIKNEDCLACYGENYDLIYSRRLSSSVTEALYDGTQYLWLNVGGHLIIMDTKEFTELDPNRIYPDLSGFTPKSISSVKEGFVLVKCKEGSVCVDVQRGIVTSKRNATGLMRKLLEQSDNGASTLAFGPIGGLWVAYEHGGFYHYPSVEGPSTLYGDLCDIIISSHIRDYAQNLQHFWFISGPKVSCYDIAKKRILCSVDIPSILNGTYPFSIDLRDDGTVLVNNAPRRTGAVVIGLNADGDPEVKDIVINQKNGSVAFAGQDGFLLASRGAHLQKLSRTGEEEDTTVIFNDNACYASHVATLFDGSVLVCYTDHCPVIYHPRRDEVELLEIPDLKQVYFFDSVQDKEGNIWLASSDNGLFRYSAKDKQINHVSNFPEIQVSGLATDGNGSVFVVGSSSNVYLFSENSLDPRVIWADTAEYPTPLNIVTLPDHTIALIGASGYVLFNHENLGTESKQSLPSHIIITSRKNVLTAFNTRAFPKGKASIYLDRHEEGLSLNIGFVPGYYNTSSYSYIYDINGFRSGSRESYDNAFIPLYGVNKVTNRVKFWIRNNNTGVESEPFTLIIRMNLLWWEMVTPILVLLLISGSAMISVNFIKKKREAESERLKREMTEKMNMENIDFFANISHEFRTPLTLIHGAVLSLENGAESVSDKARGVIKRNTDRLLKLVSQMLDFNKLEHGVLKLNIKLEPVSEIFEYTKMNFELGASMKDIDLTLNSPNAGLMGWVDRDKIEKILYNLLSNAIKYTPPGGSVTIDIDEGEKHVLNVAVSDTGVGFPEEDLGAVFDRFYQTDASKKAGGTGIGLYYTKALVCLHHGSIGVKLKKTEDGNTAGSVFWFTIPMSESEYRDDEKAENADRIVSIDSKDMMSEYVEESPRSCNALGKKQKLLIIDDDYEVVYYLKSLFADNYNVRFRFDAMSGYKLIEEFVPDIIICDVMMVDVDGIQLCRMVKNNILMSHIPFIMLTAKSTLEDQIKSLNVGADAYVVKPFHSHYLQALVKSMLENRLRVKEMLSTSTSIPPISKDSLSSQDIKFLENLYSSMEKSVQNGELDIDSMAETLGVSRAKFFYKIKALTGQTPNEYFTTYKLNYSVKFLEERKYKIAAIADMLGFSSASHFTSLFKKQFGVLPSQYSNNDNQSHNDL